jgi:hypothetical protein
MVERLLAEGIDSLSKREAMVVLSDSKVMERLHRQRFLDEQLRGSAA